MFLIFGMGKQTVKKLGRTRERICSHCHKRGEMTLVKVVDWFTLFFIPIIPYLTRFALICPHCENAREVEKGDLADLFNELNPLDSDQVKYGMYGENAGATTRSANKYRGKNPTQAAYLAKMEARERELEARDEAQARDEAEERNKASERSEPVDEASQEAARARELSLDAREKAAKERELALLAREKAVIARERALLIREQALETPDTPDTPDTSPEERRDLENGPPL